MAWSDPKTWTADDLLTASDLNQYVSDNLSALYALVQGGGRKNLLSNGAMQVYQRTNSATGKTASDYYTADRWWAGISGVGTWTQSVEADAPTGSGFRNSLKMLITAGNEATVGAADFVRIAQRIEGQNLQSVKKGTASAEPLTVSWWTKSNKTGTYVVELYDVDNTRHVSATYTVAASGTWEQQSVTFPADLTGAFDNDANRSLDLVFWLAAGTDWTGGALDTTWAAVTSEGASPGTTADNNRAAGQTNLAATNNNYWMVTGCQLEIGSASTGFEFKSFEQELAECQRYYYHHTTQPGVIGTGVQFDASSLYCHIHPPVTMRTSPAVINQVSGTNYFAFDRAGAADTFDSFAVDGNSTTTTIRISTDTGISGTAGDAGVVRTNNNAAQLGFSADL